MKTTNFCILVSIFLIVFAVGCDKRNINVPTDPTQVSTHDAKRVLAFTLDESKLNGDKYYINLFNTNNGYADAEDDIVVVAWGDSLTPMIYRNFPGFFSGWVSDVSIPLSDEQHITLRINDSVILNTFVSPVNKASVAFPEHYDYSQPYYLNWAVSSRNQYQFVLVNSYNNVQIDGGDNLFSSFVRQIPANQSSFTIPANCVALFNDSAADTEIRLMVEEVNYKIVNKTAVMVYQIEGHQYSYNTKANKVVPRLEQRILDIHNSLSR